MEVFNVPKVYFDERQVKNVSYTTIYSDSKYYVVYVELKGKKHLSFSFDNENHQMKLYKQIRDCVFEIEKPKLSRVK